MSREVLIERISAAGASFKMSEDTDGKKLFLEGIAMQSEIKNQNGRVYPRSEISKAVDSMMEKIKEHGPILGECDHPEGLNINIDRVSHLIHGMKMVGNDGHCRIQIVPEGLGKNIYALVKYGAQLGVSTRGSGDVDTRGYVSDFDIVTIDVVANPSAQDAYPVPVFESLQRDKHGRELMMLTESLRHDAAAQKYIQKAVLGFLNNNDIRKA